LLQAKVSTFATYANKIN